MPKPHSIRSIQLLLALGTYHWSAMKCSDGFRCSAAYKIPQAQLTVLVLLKCCKFWWDVLIATKKTCRNNKIENQSRFLAYGGIELIRIVFFPDVVSKWLHTHYFHINPQVSTCAFSSQSRVRFCSKDTPNARTCNPTCFSPMDVRATKKSWDAPKDMHISIKVDIYCIYDHMINIA